MSAAVDVTALSRTGPARQAAVWQNRVGDVVEIRQNEHLVAEASSKKKCPTARVYGWPQMLLIVESTSTKILASSSGFSSESRQTTDCLRAMNCSQFPAVRWEAVHSLGF